MNVLTGPAFIWFIVFAVVCIGSVFILPLMKIRLTPKQRKLLISLAMQAVRYAEQAYISTKEGKKIDRKTMALQFVKDSLIAAGWKESDITKYESIIRRMVEAAVFELPKTNK